MSNSVSSGDRAPSAHRWIPGLLPILLIAAALRALLAAFPLLHHADELWQYLEPAYRLLTGRGIVTWEYREGIRTWIVPVLLAGPMAIGRLIAPGTELYILLPKAMLAIASLLLVWIAARIGERLSRAHALFAAYVVAIWFECVYFASRTLSEPIAILLLVPALYLLLIAARPQSARRYALAGLLLGLTAVVRFQLAPCLLLAAILGCGRRWRGGWLPLIAGGIAALAIDGLIDLAMGATPFLWIARNVGANLVQNRSADYGVEGPFFYLRTTAHLWGYATLPILLLALAGARRFPALLAIALLNILVHSLIGHKEYRFILPSTFLILLLAAIGTGDLFAVLRHRIGRRQGQALAAFLALFWLAASAGVAKRALIDQEWQTFRKSLVALEIAHAAPGVCGLAFYEPGEPLWGAYTFYDRPTRIYSFDADRGQADALRWRPAYNVAITPFGRGAELGNDYTLLGCSQRQKRKADGSPGLPPLECVYHRPGTCTPPPSDAHDLNTVLQRYDR